MRCLSLLFAAFSLAELAFGLAIPVEGNQLDTLIESRDVYGSSLYHANVQKREEIYPESYGLYARADDGNVYNMEARDVQDTGASFALDARDVTGVAGADGQHHHGLVRRKIHVSEKVKHAFAKVGKVLEKIAEVVAPPIIRVAIKAGELIHKAVDAKKNHDNKKKH